MKNKHKKINIKIREIVFSGEEEKSFCDVFVYEPENIGEQALGNLYIVGEIVNLSESSSYLVNLLASIIKKEFYLNTKRTAMESLEASLHKVNSTLSDLAEQGNVDWAGNLSMICAVYSKNELHLSQTGNAKTLLIRNGQITDIEKNIIKEEKTHPFRTFANIASGELEIGDLALFATPRFFNIFSLEKLRKLSLSFGFDEFVEKLQSSIEQEEEVGTMGLLAVKIEKEKQEAGKIAHTGIESVACKIQKEKSKDTERKIEKWVEDGVEEEMEIKKEEETNAKISEKEEEADIKVFKKEEKISLENIIKEYEEAEKEDNEEKERDINKAELIGEEQDEEKTKTEEPTEKSDFMEVETEEEKSKKSIFNKLSGIYDGVLNFTKTKIVAPIAKYIKKIVEKTNDDISEEVSGENETGLFHRLKLIFGKSKFLLIAFVIVATVLTGNIIFTNYQEKEKDKFEKYNNILSQAEGKISEIESIVIYGDFETARELLINARSSALEVKNEYDKLDGEADALLKKIQDQLDKVDFVVRISNPKVVLDLSQAEGLENAGGIMEIKGERYIFDSANNSLFQTDFENGKVDRVQMKSDNDFGQFKLSTAMEKTGEIIFLTDSNKIVAFDVNKKELSGEEIKFSSVSPNVKSVASYSSFLYLLKPDSNQIYKHGKTANGFKEGKIWIEDPEADLRNAVSLAIDGLIYVLKSDGSVDKYLRGSKFKSDNDSDFAIDKLGDPISNPTEIYTKSNLDYLYIIEPQKNRIVLFDKNDGKLFKQYISADFNNLKNIVVSEKEEKMYVLNGDKVFEMEF